MVVSRWWAGYIAVVSGLGAMGCAGMNQPQPQPSGSALVVNDASPSPNVVPGGQMNQPVDSPMIQDAAAKAIGLLQAKTGDSTLSLVKIRSAASQVVAGTKFYLDLDVQTQAGPKAVSVVVYRDLQDNYSLSGVSGL